MTSKGRGSSTRIMARESSLGESLLRLTPKGMISFPAIGSREEESSTMEDRRLGWNEERGRQGCVYIWGFILQQGSKSYLYRLYMREYANGSNIYVILSWKSIEIAREPMEDERR
jgi:hypothetical protein